MDDEIKGPVYREFDPVGFLVGLTRDLEPIALPAEAQIRWLAEQHVPIEELWLQLVDQVDGVPYAVKVGTLSVAAEAAISALYEQMDKMAVELFLSYAALDDPAWQTARELAAEALEQVRAAKPAGGT
jgi:hypothetical protein